MKGERDAQVTETLRGKKERLWVEKPAEGLEDKLPTEGGKKLDEPG